MSETRQRPPDPPAAMLPPRERSSAFAPFRHATYSIIWAATVIANIGSWMYSAASGWLMTTLDPSPLIVALVQVATTLPLFLFALPAGALADILDRRKLLIFAEAAATAISAIFALLVTAGLATPANLLLFTFLISVTGALAYPAWQAIVPQLVPKGDLAAAIAANSVGMNISRAVGPALGGVMIAALGIAAPFWFNAVSNVVIIGALMWWRPPRKTARHRLPAERFGSAVRAGFRHARYNSHLRATLMRAVGFFLFGSAYWALLPLVARSQIAGGPDLYGLLLGAIGCGAIGGAFALPFLNKVLGPDEVTATGTLGTALSLTLYGLAREPAVALTGSLVAGMSWIMVLASLNISAQVALPDWVRGRGLAMFVTVFFGAMTLGSAIWGQVAQLLGLPAAHFIAAAGALLVIPLTWRWKLHTAAGVDLTPSMHWPAPMVSAEIEHDQGPVLVTVEYRIGTRDREPFLAALDKLAQERRRDGAYAWDVFEDAAAPGRFLETFLVESWLEHLRQHQRVTNADRLVQDAVWRFDVEGTPKVSHFIAAEPAAEDAAS